MWLWRYRSSSPKDGRDLDKEATIVGDIKQYPRKADAWKAAEALRLSINRPKPADEITFGAVVGRYLLEQLPDRGSTASRYRSWIRNHIQPRWAHVPLSELKPLSVEEWIKSLKLAPKSKGHIRSIMHLVFEWAMRWELVPMERNPMSLVKVKGSSKRQREPRALTIAEFQLLVTRLREPFRTMCIVAVCLGLRVSELFGLQWGDFDWDSLRVKLQRSWVYGAAGAVKTVYSEKWMSLDASLAEVLLQHRKRTSAGGLIRECKWVFANPLTARPRWPSRIVENHFVPVGVATGLGRVGWHTFRHTYATMLGTFGVDLKVQQELLRHADIRTTMNIYTHAVPDALREAQVEQGERRSDGHAVVAADVGGQAALAKKPLKDSESVVFSGGRKRLTGQEKTAGMVGDGEWVTVLMISQQELALVIGAPEFIGTLAQREWSSLRASARAAAALDQAMAIHHRMNGALRRDFDAGESA